MSEYVETELPGPGDPAALVARCIESGARSLLLGENALVPEFFDLSSGFAGELVQKNGDVPDPRRGSLT